MPRELDLQFKSTKDIYSEDRSSAYGAGFTQARIDMGSGGLFDDLEPKARETGIKQLPDYDDNKEAYDSYLYEGWYNNRDLFDAKYTQAIDDKIYDMDKDGNLIPGEGHFFGAEALIDKTTYKGHLLAKRNNFDITPHYQKVVKDVEKTLEGAEKNAFMEFLGSMAGVLSTPEIVQEVATSPAKIVASSATKGFAKAFGTEALVALGAETGREAKRRRHARLMGKDKSLTDSGKELLINSAFAGFVRGAGSVVYDKVATRNIRKSMPSATDKEIWDAYTERELKSLYQSKKGHRYATQKATEDLEAGRPVDLGDSTEIDIDTKTDPNIEKISISEEVKATPEYRADFDNTSKLEQEVEYTKENAQTDEPYTFKPLEADEEAVIAQYANDSRLTDDPEYQQLLKEIEELENPTIDTAPKPDTTTEVIQPKPSSAKATRHPAIQYIHDDGSMVSMTKGEWSTLKAYQKNMRNGRSATQKQKDAYLKHEAYYDENEGLFSSESEFEPKMIEKEDPYASLDQADVEELNRQALELDQANIEDINRQFQEALDDPAKLQDFADEYVPKDANGNPVFAKFGDNIAAGMVAGVEQDEKGNWTFDPAKFVAGLGGYTAAKEVLKIMAKSPGAKKTALKWMDELERTASKQSNGAKINANPKATVAATGLAIGASTQLATQKPSKKDESASTVKAKSGDSIWKILKENGIKTNTTNIEAFKDANGLKNNTIQAGAEYKLPSAKKVEAKIKGASVLKAPAKGSTKATIKALQKKIGATADGDWGMRSKAKLDQYNGVSDYNVKDKNDFVSQVKPEAERVAKKIGELIDPSWLVTMWRHETANGQSGVTQNTYNLGNIKDFIGDYWKGDNFNAGMVWEDDASGKATKEKSSFRKYKNFTEAANDFVKFLSTKRYTKVREAKTKKEFFQALKNAGYATDSKYVDKMMKLG